MSSPYFSTAAAMRAYRQSLEQMERQHSLNERWFRRQQGLNPPAPPYPVKCPSCGSREFVTHHSQTVCRYCRSAA